MHPFPNLSDLSIKFDMYAEDVYRERYIANPDLFMNISKNPNLSKIKLDLDMISDEKLLGMYVIPLQTLIINNYHYYYCLPRAINFDILEELKIHFDKRAPKKKLNDILNVLPYIPNLRKLWLRYHFLNDGRTDFNIPTNLALGIKCLKKLFSLYLDFENLIISRNFEWV